MEYLAWCDEIKLKILSKCQINAVGCSIWLGGPHDVHKYPYGTMSVTFPGDHKSKSMRVHRLMYMVHNNKFNLQSDLHVSHICHHRRCVNPEHLVLEAAQTNAERNFCKNNGICLATHVPHCIL